MNFLKAKAWSPYFAGALIGLLQIPAYLLAHALLGTSSSYVKVAGHLFGWLQLNTEIFGHYLTAEKYRWQLALVVGIVIGAFLSSRLSNTPRKACSPIWETDYGWRPGSWRNLIALLGGFLLIFGARLAGGCTSGHGISGAAQLSLSSWLAVGAMFSGGILFTLLLRRRPWGLSSRA